MQNKNKVFRSVLPIVGAILAICLLLFSCEDTDHPKSFEEFIVGTWTPNQDNSPGDGTFRNQHRMVFGPDGYFETNQVVIDPQNDFEIVGYLSLQVGTYEVIDEVVKIPGFTSYIRPDESADYTDRNNLIEEYSTTEVADLLFTQKDDHLIYHIDCHPGNLSCMAYQVIYYRLY